MSISVRQGIGDVPARKAESKVKTKSVSYAPGRPQVMATSKTSTLAGL